MTATDAQVTRFLAETGASGLVLFEETSRQRTPDGRQVERKFDAQVYTLPGQLSKTSALALMRRVVQGFEDELVRGEPLD